MTDVMTVEQRLAALEKEVTDLKQKLELLAEPSRNWLEQIGARRDVPEPVWKEYQEILAEIKQEGRPPDED
jgi:hypothetical protein